MRNSRVFFFFNMAIGMEMQSTPLLCLPDYHRACGTAEYKRNTPASEPGLASCNLQPRLEGPPAWVNALLSLS